MATTASRTRELDHAVYAVADALAALRASTGSATLRVAVERARTALDRLEPHLTTIVLDRLLVSIEDCRRDGRSTSPRLEICRRSAARALRLDPRWYHSPAAVS